MINKLGEIIIKPEYENIKKFDYNWIKLKQNNKYGLVNIYDGKEILSIRYDYISGALKNIFIAVIYEEDKKNIKECSIINSSQEKILVFDENTKYTEDNFLSGMYINGLFTVRLHGKYALYNSEGEIIPPVYSYIMIYYDKWVKAYNEDGNYDLFDSTGRKIASYDYIQFIKENEAIISTGEKVGYMNFKTGVFIPDVQLREEMEVRKVIDKKRKEEGENLYRIEKSEFMEGGKENFSNYLAKRLQYPEKAIDRGTEGKVFIRFVINREGEISSAFTTGLIIGDGLEEEAIKALYSTRGKKWKSAKIEGIPVDSYFKIPITFRLPN